MSDRNETDLSDIYNCIQENACGGCQVDTDDILKKLDECTNKIVAALLANKEASSQETFEKYQNILLNLDKGA